MIISIFTNQIVRIVIKKFPYLELKKRNFYTNVLEAFFNK